MKLEAEKFYIERRGNCAQSVIHGWSQYSEKIKNGSLEVSDAGHGNADGGMCGALFAASEIAGVEKRELVIQKFKEKSKGHTGCRSIRKSRSLSCVECVGTAASILQECL